MRPGWGGLVGVALGVALAACTGPGQQRAVAPKATPGVTAREDLTRRFVIFVGPKAQHAAPFLDTPGTNFYCLRSFLDRKTGEVSYQVYVSDSYFGAERRWSAARDAAGDPLRFVHLSTDEITCDGSCSYAEEFAATIPESELHANPSGFAVTFSAQSGDEKKILVSGEQVAAQIAAVEARRSPVSPAAAAMPRQ
jgi:hypothetical protein